MLVSHREKEGIKEYLIRFSEGSSKRKPMENYSCYRSVAFDDFNEIKKC